MDIAVLGLSVNSAPVVKATNDLDKMSASAGKASAATAALGKSASGSNQGLRNLSMQLGQVAQQGAATGNYMQALSIQMPDLLIGFGLWGAALGAAAGALGPLIMGMMDAGDEAQTLDERLRTLDSLSRGLKDAQDILSMSVNDLAQQYGEYAGAVRDAANALAALQAAEARVELGKSIEQMDDIFRRYTATANSAFSSGTTLGMAIANVAQDMGLASQGAREFVGLLEALENAVGPDAQADALASIHQYLIDNNIELEKIPPALRAALIEANNLTIAMSDVAAEAARAAAATQGMTYGVPLEWSNDLIPPDAPDSPAPRRAARRSGAGGISEAQKRQNELMREAEAIFAATRTEAERYAMELADLNDLHKMGYLDGETYARALDGIKEQYDPLRQKMEEFRDVSKDAFVGLVTGADSLRDALSNVLMKLAEMAAADAFDALLAGGKGKAGGSVVGSLFDGIFGGFRAAGGPVSSGKSYIVGENGPELFTPPNSGNIVPNNALSGGQPGAMDVRVYVDQDGYWRAAVEAISGGVAARVVQNYDNRILRGRVKQINEDVRRRGG